MKTNLLLIAIACAAIFFIPNDGLEAKTHISFGLDIGTRRAAPAVIYAPPPAVVVRRPVYYAGHVPVGQRFYGNPVVVYPYTGVAEEVIVYPNPPAPRVYNNFSFNWRIFR